MTTDEDEYHLDDQIGYLLRLSNQRHASIFQHRAIADLTPTQFAALVRIAELGECSQNRLGRLTSMDIATVKGVVDRLRKKGYVSLSPDPKDRRRTTIRLTEEAERMIPDLHAMGRDITDETLRPLTRNEKLRLLKSLKKIT